MDIVIITKFAQSVQRLHPHMREDAHSPTPLVNIALSMTLWSTAAAKHAVNAAITFYDFNCLNAYH